MGYILGSWGGDRRTAGGCVLGNWGRQGDSESALSSMLCPFHSSTSQVVWGAWGSLMRFDISEPVQQLVWPETEAGNGQRHHPLYPQVWVNSKLGAQVGR